MRAALLFAILLVAACQGTETATERFTGEDEGFSCELPTAWTSERDKGSVIFTSEAQAKRTVVVRSIARSDTAVDQAFLNATDVVMQGLPDVEITSKRAVTGTLPGMQYELSFVPPRAAGRYARTHVILLGKEHVFHVIETAPLGTATDDALLTRLIGSFKEEV